MIKILYQRPKCIACGYCSNIAPHFWYNNPEDGKCDLFGSFPDKENFILEIFDEDLPIMTECVDACPAKCIHFEN